MLRVLHVIGKMDRAGAESFIMNLYRNVDKAQIQFDFLVFSYDQGDYDREIMSLGGKIYRMPSFKGYNYWDLYRRFEKFFKEHPYKVVHGHIGSLAPAYLYWAKKNGAYTIAHSHATNSSNWIKKKIYWLLSHNVTKVADHFFACSYQAGKDRFGSEIVGQNNFAIIKNCVTTSMFQYSIRRHDELKKKFQLEDKFVIGHVGRFTEAKNHKFLLVVFKEIIKKIDNAELLLVGRGELESEIRKIVKDEGIERKVQFMGVRDDIPDMMNLFDVFLFTSLYEGLGNVCIEAQAAGLPCFVSTAIQDEAIITGNVWRYPLNWTPEKWADEIINQLNTFNRKDEIQAVIDSGYDAEQVAETLTQFYRTCRQTKK